MDLPDGVHRVPSLGHNIECDLQAAIVDPRHHFRNQIRNQMCQSEMIDRACRVQWARESMGSHPCLQEVWALGGREEMHASLPKARILERIRPHDVPMYALSRDRARAHILGLGD